MFWFKVGLFTIMKIDSLMVLAWPWYSLPMMLKLVSVIVCHPDPSHTLSVHHQKDMDYALCHLHESHFLHTIIKYYRMQIMKNFHLNFS